MSLNLRIHVLQHVAFEGPAAIEKWLMGRGHSLSVTKLYQNESLPTQNDFDWLIVMGGPMGVDDIEQYPWLKNERKFILNSIESGKCILGICLGSQLIAAALGAKVKKNKYREIGWFDITRSEQIKETILGDIWPESIEVFHWHGDTFEIPVGAQRLASSEACSNQGFILNNKIIGLQFHLEVTPESIGTLIENCNNELDGSVYVQSEKKLIPENPIFIKINQLLSVILEVLEKNAT